MSFDPNICIFFEAALNQRRILSTLTLRPKWKVSEKTIDSVIAAAEAHIIIALWIKAQNGQGDAKVESKQNKEAQASAASLQASPSFIRESWRTYPANNLRSRLGMGRELTSNITDSAKAGLSFKDK
jgi:hypothetical protein